VFAFETIAPTPGQTTGEPARQTALVEVAIGPASPINSSAATGINHPGIVDDDVVYTSEAWRFGMPAIAVSGDRASVVVYEGDRADPTSDRRYEMRLQQDKVTGAVTGGGSLAVGLDSGNWRDHEIAALYNVLAVAQRPRQRGRAAALVRSRCFVRADRSVRRGFHPVGELAARAGRDGRRLLAGANLLAE
jgi:hypothetical protein